MPGLESGLSDSALPIGPDEPNGLPADGTPFSDDPVEHSILSATFMVFIMIVWLIFGHKIQGMFSWTKWISEGSMACLLGVLSGVLLLLWDVVNSGDTHRSLSFDSAIFFTYMLPPIIFYGGLAIRRTLFVENLLSICAFGILGTFVSFSLLGAILASLSLLPNILSLSDCFSLAAIFAATDSVAVLQVLRPESQPALYSIVLGEGVMNDAASVALLKSVSNLSDAAGLSFTTLLSLLTFFIYVFVASFTLGLVSGLCISWVMKHGGPFSQPQEVSLVGALAFLCYLIAESLGWSGILALFFCGMAVSHYALQHVSLPSRAALLNAFRTLSYLLEGFIFLYVGRDTLDPAKWANASFLQSLMLLVVISLLVAISRAAFVFPLAWLHNRWSNQKLSVNESITIWWAGMMRGAVSVAMVYYRFDPKNNSDDSHAATIVVTTLQVVLYSTVGLGGVTGPLLQILLPSQVSPPDVTGAQLVGAGPLSASEFSPHADDGLDDSLLGSHSHFPTAEDLSPASPAHTENASNYFFQGHAKRRQASSLFPESRLPQRLQEPPSSGSKGNHALGREEAKPSATTDVDSELVQVHTDPDMLGDTNVTAAPGGSSWWTGSAAKGSIHDVGNMVLSTAHNIAHITGFDAPTPSDRGIGHTVLKQFKKIDEQYLQPAFGKESGQSHGQSGNGDAEPSDEASSPQHKRNDDESAE